jgi:hypothetical protein
MASTTTLLGPEFAKSIVNSFIQGIDQGTKLVARIFWDTLMSFLHAHWFAVMTGLFILLVIATLKAMMGRWGALGSLIYNLLYFGTLFIVGLIWGPEIFINDFFNVACAVILYPICYYITGQILNKIGFLRFT